MLKILLVEDSADIGELVKWGLGNYEVVQAPSILQAEDLIRDHGFDLYLIDVGLPDGNGFEFCMRLSQDQRFQSVPKIMLTGHATVPEKVYGFNCGADDYLTKPFDPSELRARVDRYLARGTKDQGGIEVHEGFEFNLEFQRCVHIADRGEKRDLRLTPTEFRLFLILARRKGHVVSRVELEKAGWEANGTVIELRGIDTHIAHLRKKLGVCKDWLTSVYGQGYSYQVPDERRRAA